MNVLSFLHNIILYFELNKSKQRAKIRAAVSGLWGLAVCVQGHISDVDESLTAPSNTDVPL